MVRRAFAPGEYISGAADPEVGIAGNTELRSNSLSMPARRRRQAPRCIVLSLNQGRPALRQPPSLPRCPCVSLSPSNLPGR